MTGERIRFLRHVGMQLQLVLLFELVELKDSDVSLGDQHPDEQFDVLLHDGLVDAWRYQGLAEGVVHCYLLFVLGVDDPLA